jgi:hypothetical protein
MPYSNVINTKQASDTSIMDLLCARKDGWLVSSEFKNRPNVSFHYAKYHILRDWFRFLSDAFDANLLTQVELTEASLVDRMLPAPSNGVFPVQFFIEHLQRLENCALAFKKNGYILPKPLVNVMGKPIIFWLLDNLNLEKVKKINSLLIFRSTMSTFQNM